jgi:hypothetical protein
LDRPFEEEDLLQRIVKRRPSPATIISLVALFVALGGTSYAAIALAPKNSVGSAQVIDGSLQNKDLSRKTVAALKGSRGQDGAPGSQGASGVAGAIGATGPGGLPGAAGTSGAPGTTGATGPIGPSGAVGATGPEGPPNPNALDSQKLGGLGPDDYQKVPTVAEHFTIPATALVDADGLNRVQVQGAGLEYCVQSGGDRLQAAVNLPQGAIATGWSADYLDDSGTTTSNGPAWLTRVPLFGRGGTYGDLYLAPMVNTASPGDTATASTTTPTSGTAGLTTIDNTKYTYTVITAPIAGAAVCGLDVTYTVAPGFAATAPVDGTRSKGPASSK